MNEQQQFAFNVVKNKQNLFMTGSAGTGKSFTLSKIVEYLEKEKINYALTALTGCASVLINGQTLHSYLCLGISRDLNEIYKNISKYKPVLAKLKKLETLIIDEISMMDDELFILINNLFQMIKNNDKIFGGIQVILVGDFYQLPPISNDYCFTCDIWKQLNLVPVILTELIRQKNDLILQEILEEIRNCCISANSFKILKNLKNTSFTSKDIKPTRLYPINVNVNKINDYEFKKLVKKNNNETITYNAICNKKTIDLKDYHITLTLNAQVMVIRNINIENRLFNGTRGIVTEMNDTNVIIKDIYDNYHTISYYTDKNNNNDNIKISFMPLKLAYAMSIHKSQGSSIDVLEIDLGDDIFISGQLYTALSRATNINNIRIVNLSKNSFMTNEKVKNFYMNL
jgi:ATP-dependent DNA helicase PIF1